VAAAAPHATCAQAHLAAALVVEAVQHDLYCNRTSGMGPWAHAEGAMRVLLVAEGGRACWAAYQAAAAAPALLRRVGMQAAEAALHARGRLQLRKGQCRWA